MSFYKAVNAEWEDRTIIPDDQGKWGGFVELQHKCKSDLIVLLSTVVNNPLMQHLIVVKLYNYYKNMSQNIDQIEFDDNLDFIISNKHGYDDLFHIDKTPDPENPSFCIMDITPSGLSLPHNDYSDSTKMLKFRDHLRQVAELFNIQDTNWADSIVEFEKHLASYTMTPTQSRRFTEYMTRIHFNDLTDTSVLTLKSLPEKSSFQTSDLNLNSFKTLLGTIYKGMMVIYDGDGFRARLSLMHHPAYNAFRKYKQILSFKEIKKLDQVMFEMYGDAIKNKAFDERILDLLNKIVPEQIGQLYADKYFNGQLELTRMIELIRNTCRQFICWSDFAEATEKEAIYKILSLNIKAGAPEIRLDSYHIYDVVDVHIYNFDKMLRTLGQPINPDNWSLNPHIVNARSIWSQNELIFPAAIMQPPMFYQSIDSIPSYLIDNNLHCNDNLLAVNMGAIGCIIAHEMTHALDDRGRHYDKNARLRKWMTDADIEIFTKGASIIKQQIQESNDNTEYKIDSDLVMTEVMADIGGLQIAFQTLKNAVGALPYRVLAYKLFFLSYATTLRIKIRPDVFARELKANPHAPAEFRVNLVRNIPEFHTIFPELASPIRTFHIWRTEKN